MVLMNFRRILVSVGFRLEQDIKASGKKAIEIICA
jgi:hypothetical protein